MATEPEIIITKEDYEEITDPKEIEKLNKINPYISKMEGTDTLDQDAMNHMLHATSAGVIGQHRDIEIAVWHDDPHKDSPDHPYRIHMRVMNGRHRLLQDPSWKRKYYNVGKAKDPVMAYFQLRQHFDLQKKSNPKEKEILIRQLGMYLIKEKGIPPYKCCDRICDILVPLGVASANTIISHCPDEYKEKSRQTTKDLTYEKRGMETKEAKKIRAKVSQKTEKYEAENLRLQKELDNSIKEGKTIQDQLNKLEKEFDEVQSKLRIVSQLEETVEIDSIKIKVSIDATNNKLIIKKA